MKRTQRILSVISILSLIVFSNCGGDDAKPVPEKTALKKLSKTWSIKTSGGAKLGTTDRTDDFTNFKIIIGGLFDSSTPEGPYTYEVQGARPTPSPWPGPDLGSDGTWTFAAVSDASGTLGQIIRDDGVVISYNINSSGELTLIVQCGNCADFNYIGSSKVNAVGGVWTFILN